MVNNIAVRFLGTASQTNVTRNYSSLLVKLDHHTVMVDCGESTQRQLQNRFVGGEEKLSSIRHIFITHLHMDHVSGLVPLLCAMMGPGNASTSTDKAARVEIFGPSGLRALLRSTLTLCYASLTGCYTVHELLWPSQSAYPNQPLTSIEGDVVGASMPEGEEPLLGATNGPRRTIPHLPPHENELPGKDFRLDEETVSWPHIAVIDGVNVSAAPILHRVPTLGYIFNEPPSASTSVTPEILTALDANATALESEQNIKNPKSLLGKLLKDRQTLHLPDGTTLEPPKLDVRGRKLVILGDTYDATAGLEAGTEDEEGNEGSAARGMLALAQDADVLVHECTNAALPAHLQPGSKKEDEKREEVRAKALLRGHSTPQVAGQFAAKCGVRQLLLNHIGIKYPAPSTKAPHSFASAPNRGANGQGSHDERDRRYLAIRDIEQQATDAWHDGLLSRQSIHVKSARARRAIAAFDGYVYRVIKISDVPGSSNVAASEEESAHDGLDEDGVEGEEGQVSPLASTDEQGRGRHNGSIPREPLSMAIRGRGRAGRIGLRGAPRGRGHPSLFRGGYGQHGPGDYGYGHYSPHARGTGRPDVARGRGTPQAPRMPRGHRLRGRPGGQGDEAERR